jgi:hypothetical protein
MTGMGQLGPHAGARSQADGAVSVAASPVNSAAAMGVGSPDASAVRPVPRLCGHCDRPRPERGPARRDTEHAVCDRVARRMDNDLAARRRSSDDAPWMDVQW